MPRPVSSTLATQIMANWLSSEEEILRRIVSNTQTVANTIHFALDTAFPHPEHAFAQNIFIGINIPRKELGLDPKDKPGDIDYLIVPFTDKEVMLSKTIGIEAKIVRPTIEKPSRNANSMGETQAKGLLRDGFPFVGLLHISIPEPLPKEMRWSLPIMSNELGPNGELVETGEFASLDWFPTVHAERHKGRILALDLPLSIAYKVISFNLSRDNESFSGNTMNESRRGYLNPNTSSGLLKSIELLLNEKPHYFQQIIWFNKNAS